MTNGNLNSELISQLRADFLVESREILERISQLLTGLEREPSADLVQVLFRELHTLKGTAGFAGINTIHRIAHKLEDLFGEVRAHQLPISQTLMDEVFAGVELIHAVREDLLEGGSGMVNCEPLLARLSAIQRGEVDTIDTIAPTSMPSSPHTISTTIAVDDANADYFEGGFNTGGWPAIDELLDGNKVTRVATTMRVEVAALDNLMVLFNQLCGKQEQLIARARYLADKPLLDTVIGITEVTCELTETINRLRLVAIGRLFNRFIAVVRNLAHERNLQVHLETSGGEITLDRIVLEQMTAPFIHLLRNAIDHGLETSQVRLQMGKPEQGLIRLTAAIIDEQVILTITDDGRGIDPAQLRLVAIERGLFPESEVLKLTDEQTLRLIFTPGFSTTEAITESSGRGVGLDVALANVQSLGGTIDIDTQPGQGTTFTIRLPIS